MTLGETEHERGLSGGWDPDQPRLFSSAGNNAHSPWVSEAVNRGQGRKTGPKQSISIGIQFIPVSEIPALIMLSPLHLQCDPSFDELSPNGPSLRGACVGQHVWNQLYKGDLSLPSLPVQPGHAQLLGQGELGATAGAAALLAGFGWGYPATGLVARLSQGSGLSLPIC